MSPEKTALLGAPCKKKSCRSGEVRQTLHSTGTTLNGLPSQIKLKIMLLIVSDKFKGKVRFELLKINFDKPRALTIFILPIKVSFLFFQIFNTFSMFRSFSLKLRLFALVVAVQFTRRTESRLVSSERLCTFDYRCFHWYKIIASHPGSHHVRQF